MEAKLMQYTQGMICSYHSVIKKDTPIAEQTGDITAHPVMIVSARPQFIPTSYVQCMMLSTSYENSFGYRIYLNSNSPAYNGWSVICSTKIFNLPTFRLGECLGFAPPQLVQKCLKGFLFELGLTDEVPEYYANHPVYSEMIRSGEAHIPIDITKDNITQKVKYPPQLGQAAQWLKSVISNPKYSPLLNVKDPPALDPIIEDDDLGVEQENMGDSAPNADAHEIIKSISIPISEVNAPNTANSDTSVKDSRLARFGEFAPDEDLMVRQVAYILNLPETKVRSMCRAGVLDFIRVDTSVHASTIIVKPDSIVQYVVAHPDDDTGKCDQAIAANLLHASRPHYRNEIIMDADGNRLGEVSELAQFKNARSAIKETKKTDKKVAKAKSKPVSDKDELPRRGSRFDLHKIADSLSDQLKIRIYSGVAKYSEFRKNYPEIGPKSFNLIVKYVSEEIDARKERLKYKARKVLSKRKNEDGLKLIAGVSIYQTEYDALAFASFSEFELREFGILPGKYIELASRKGANVNYIKLVRDAERSDD